MEEFWEIVRENAVYWFFLTMVLTDKTGVGYWVPMILGQFLIAVRGKL